MRLVLTQFLVICLALIPTVSCRSWKEVSPQAGSTGGPWRSKAESDGPNHKGKPGPYLPFSGTKTQNGKVRHEVNLYGFGMDRFEDGKLANDTWERWELKYQDPDPQPTFAANGGLCTLERIVAMKSNSHSIIFVKDYSTRGGTLKITGADWSEGILNFEFGDEYEDNPFQCQLQFEQIEGSTYLRSFRAVAVKKSEFNGKMFIIEYRPAEHSYTLNIPLSMTGMKTGQGDSLR